MNDGDAQPREVRRHRRWQAQSEQSNTLAFAPKVRKSAMAQSLYLFCEHRIIIFAGLGEVEQVVRYQAFHTSLRPPPHFVGGEWQTTHPSTHIKLHRKHSTLCIPQYAALCVGQSNR